jgi:phosphomevalonate kinase
MTVALAPGKAILCGEYAVLHGAPAISVATDRSVRAWIAPGSGTALSPFVVAALQQVAAELRKLNRPTEQLLQSGAIGVDSTALYEKENKLGLGSSAAVTVAVTGAALASAGVELADKRRLFELADQAHATAQGTRGSGVDVATSVWGGAIRFQRKGGHAEISSVELPDEVRLTFVFTGKSASTAELIGRVKALAERDPAAHEAAIGRLVWQAHAFAAAIADKDASALLHAADGYHEAMRELGVAAGAEIVTAEHAQLAALARRNGGAAKPSGAGGGDLGVAFTVGGEATRALREDLERAGLTPLSVGAPAPGLRLEMES